MLYSNTDDGSSAQWVLNDDGVVVDNIAIYGAERAPILEQINEHYGTSFTGWSDNEIYLRYGDSLPNWNAYEKILIQLKDGFYKFDFSGGAGQVYTGMIVQNGNVGLYASSLESGSNICVYGPQGNFISANANENLIPQIQEICSKYPNFVSISKYVKDNSNLENWSEYSLLT